MGPWERLSPRSRRPWTATTPGLTTGPAADKDPLDAWKSSLGAVIGGRATYEAAGRWGDTNPWGVPFFILTHRLDQQPSAAPGLSFVGSLDEALARAREAAGERDVQIMGGGDVIRQALPGEEVTRSLARPRPLSPYLARYPPSMA